MNKTASERDRRATTALGGVFGLVLSYAFVSRAFSTGSYWQYLGSVVFLVLGAKLLIRASKANHHVKTRKSR